MHGGTSRRLVEGQRAAPDDETQHRLQIVEHVACGQPKNVDILLGKPGIAPCIPVGVAAHVVRQSIDLDREARRRAVEVQHIRADWMLPPKLGDLKLLDV